MHHVNKMKVSSKIFRGPGFDHTIYIGVEISEKGIHPHPLWTLYVTSLKQAGLIKLLW